MSELTGPVHVIGAGLLGTSVALAARRAGLAVYLSDRHPEHVRTASSLGAGTPYDGQRAQIVVVATPPDHLAEVIVTALESDAAAVTDVGSVKSAPLAGVLSAGRADRYVGSHPMAGSERSGPLAASATLFDGRPWAITPHQGSSPDAVGLVSELARLCGGLTLTMDPDEHDRAVARTSHLPHLMSALTAGRLTTAPGEHLALSGQGVRDVTRIAGGDPCLWQQILTANAPALVEVLSEVRERLDVLIEAVGSNQRPMLVEVLSEGVSGAQAIPGKHGRPAVAMASIFVALPDEPGGLARLFADAGESGVNIEDVRIDHDPGREVGLVELDVAAARAEDLLAVLRARGWSAHS